MEGDAASFRRKSNSLNHKSLKIQELELGLKEESSNEGEAQEEREVENLESSQNLNDRESHSIHIQ